MIKFAVAALWIAAVAIGAVFVGARAPADPAAEAEPAPPLMGGLDYLKTEVISVPVVQARAVTGYFLARLVYTAEPADLQKLTVPADVLLTDAVYSYLYGRPEIDVAQIDRFDAEAFREGVREGVNKRLGTPLLKDVMIEQVDFLTKEEIRDNSLRRKQAEAQAKSKQAKPDGPAEGHGQAAPEPEQAQAGGHEAPAH